MCGADGSWISKVTGPSSRGGRRIIVITQPGACCSARVKKASKLANGLCSLASPRLPRCCAGAVGPGACALVGGSLPVRRTVGWVVAGLLGAATTYEVAWVTVQHARGVPAHFNDTK